VIPAQRRLCRTHDLEMVNVAGAHFCLRCEADLDRNLERLLDGLAASTRVGDWGTD
jgi:hypothetical protein